MSLVKRQYDDFIWSLKYRPEKIEDMILPMRFRNHFETMIKEKKIPNLLLSGTRGCGKTSTAFCLADEIGMDVKYFNMSKDNSIDVIRDAFVRFASSVSFQGGKKLIIGDEFDRLSLPAIDSLKGEIEALSKNCSFIFISNNKHKFIDHPVISRLQEIDYEFDKKETGQMKKDFFEFLCDDVLKKEGVKFSKKAVGSLVNNLFPDMRKMLNELQKLATQFDNKITPEAVKSISSVSDLNILFEALKDKDFGYIREYAASMKIDPSQFYSVLFKNIRKYVTKDSFPQAVLSIEKFQYHSAFSADKQIPLCACFIELMMECEWS